MTPHTKPLTLRSLLLQATALAVCFAAARRWGLDAAAGVLAAGVLLGVDLGRRLAPRRGGCFTRIHVAALVAAVWTAGPIAAASAASAVGRQAWNTPADQLTGGLVTGLGFGYLGGLALGTAVETIDERRRRREDDSPPPA